MPRWFLEPGADGRHDVLALSRLVGDLSQLAGVTPVVYQEGAGRGVSAYQVRTGGGLRFAIRVDRGLEIAEAEYLGVPYGWQSGVGPVHPAFYETEEDGWLRLYDGGLMTMGGLDQIGEPCEDLGRRFGLHGRLANLPAVECGYRIDWRRSEIQIWGTLRQLTPTKEFLELHREVVAPIGGTVIDITDRVTNRGDRPAAHMILYHFNLGYPLLDEGCRFIAPVQKTEGWDHLSKDHLAVSRTVPGMTGEEYLFGHQVMATDGWTTAALLNPQLNGGSFCAIRYKQDTLPYLWQWISLRPGTWVMGIEPANGDIRGRAAARQRGTLSELEPGQEVEYRVQLQFGSGPEAVTRIISEAGLP